MFTVQQFENYEKILQLKYSKSLKDLIVCKESLHTLGLRAFLSNSQVAKYFGNEKLKLSEEQISRRGSLYNIYRLYEDRVNVKMNKFKFLDMEKKVRVTDKIEGFFGFSTIDALDYHDKYANTYDYLFVCDIELCATSIIEDNEYKLIITDCILSNPKYIASHSYFNDYIYHCVCLLTKWSIAENYFTENSNLCKIIVEYNPKLLCNIPIHIKNREEWRKLCIKSFREDIVFPNTKELYCEVYDLPQKLITFERIKITLQRNKCEYGIVHNILRKCPENLFTNDFCQYILSLNVKDVATYFPKKIVTTNKIKTSIEKYPIQ